MARGTGTTRKKTPEQRAEPNPDELRQRIAEAAYYRAQQRGFAPGYEEKDWIEAEAEVMRSLGR